ETLDRRPHELAAAHADDPGGCHQPCNALATDAEAFLGKIDLNAWRTVGAVRGGVRHADLRQQRRILARPPRRRSLRPRIVAAGGETQEPAHGGNRIDGLVLAHESESFGGIPLVSRANQAAAFERMSRSSRSCRFSRRSRSSSARSSDLSVSRPCSSSSACVTQRRIDSRDTRNSRCRSSAVRPDRTNATIWRRNSRGYGLPIVDLHCKCAGVHKTGSTPGFVLPKLVRATAPVSEAGRTLLFF